MPLTVRTQGRTRDTVRTAVAAGRRDAGFTLVEVMVSMVMISVVMSAAAVFYLGSLRADRMQHLSQVATRLATDGMDRVRSLQPPALPSGRDPASSASQWSAAPAQVKPYLAASQLTADPTAVNSSSALLPTSATPVTVDGVQFSRNWYLGQCWIPSGGGNCTAPKPSGSTPFYRVVVAVTWPDVVCPSNLCAYVVTTLVTANATQPVFNANDSATPPTVTNPGPQVTDVGTAANLLVHATGGTGALTWTSTGLPPGLTLSPSGSVATISGRPTVIGAYSVTVAVTDGFGMTGAATFSWRVTPPPVLQNPGDQFSTVGTPDSLAFNVTGGSSPFSWSITGLPAGLSYDHVTGAIRGTPTTATSTPATVTATVTDSSGLSSTQTFRWTVNSRLSVAPPADQWSIVNRSVTPVTPTFQGGSAPIHWAASGLPPGLSCDPSTGTMSGAPTDTGTYTVTITATDAAGATASASFTWNVVYPLSVQGIDDQTSAVGRAVTPVTPHAHGGRPPVSWTVSGLPAGLSWDPSTGTMSGTPTTVGQSTVTVTATDTSGTTASVRFRWTVNAPLTVTAPDGTIALYRSSEMSPITAHASGGIGHRSWSAHGLPQGISISKDGVISGTPRKTGDWTATITVTDSTGATAHRTVWFTVRNLDD